MSNELKKLCNMLDDEIERQENVGAVCVAQHEALCARDIEAICARNNALELLARDSGIEEPARKEAAAKVSKVFGLVPENARLRDLALHAPEPWKTRLIERRVALHNVVQSNQRLVRRNELIAKKSRTIAESWRETLFEHFSESGPAYRGDGHTPPTIHDGPAMIDQRG